MRQTYRVNGTASEENEDKEPRVYLVETAQQSGAAR